MIHIEQIRPELTWRLRRKVLYPNEPLFKMEMEEDYHGWHFGAFTDDALVAVVSLFQNDTDFQFRKLAVSAVMHGQGVGKALLQHLVNFSRAQGATRIWCNARDVAIGFYLKQGLKQTGELFSKNGIDYEIMEMGL
jgi:GNAT superfamily N-acetyltransferase